ncbi:Uncharacterized protein BP5553_06237 [Venustampulla echinocandica]|uniref:N-acetylglucosamine-induced protein 1 n=1 Tax=Venustampulla echinocandica TaxID=2656787 RepID=A0A370TMY9_9HELO|nr:Uncharacterized protein BP5553_06237 [Venustampulla echinocandica]RDL36885.1 Uncharacterized protein BP5553_06237 [Venustampulla echinocandica]
MGSTTPNLPHTAASEADASFLPYWQINVPPAERTATCPPFLENLIAKDLQIVSTPDHRYEILTWPQVQAIIVANRLDVFQRVPSQLRRYLAYNYYLRKAHGSVMNFILGERLKWEQPITAEGKPFEKETDVKILWNDWPYGIDERIVHLVVWTKFGLQDDPTTGDLTDKARGEIGAFVEEKFERRVGADNVIWFKNWGSLKSIRSVEHFHVMLFDPDPAFINEITNGDIALSRKV